MALRAKVTVDTTGIVISGNGVFADDETLAKDTAETAPLASFTVLAKRQSTAELVILDDINPALTAASMLCGANGGNIAAYTAVADGEFAINVDGTLIDITGIDMNTVTITLFQQVADAINAVALGKVICTYDLATDTFSFTSPKTGLPASTITVLTAVVAGAGTDISGTGFLNGLTAVGAVTPATGEESTAIPYGIFWGSAVTAAAIVAAAVENRKVLIAGDRYLLDEDKIVFQGGLTLASIVAATGKTISQHLRELGILHREVSTDYQVAPI